MVLINRCSLLTENADLSNYIRYKNSDERNVHPDLPRDRKLLLASTLHYYDYLNAVAFPIHILNCNFYFVCCSVINQVKSHTEHDKKYIKTGNITKSGKDIRYCKFYMFTHLYIF